MYAIGQALYMQAAAAVHANIIDHGKCKSIRTMHDFAGTSHNVSASHVLRAKANEPYHVCAFWIVGQEVHDPPALLNVGLRVGPQAMNQIWEHDTLLNEENLQSTPELTPSN